MEKTTKSSFGTIQGKGIDLYTLRNDHGVEVKISTFGATITSIVVPDQTGELEDIVCGFDKLERYFSDAYIANAPYFGCTVGRYCSQIKNSRFSLNGAEYTLAANCGDNNLHGGVQGFDKKIWEARVMDTAEVSGVSMSVLSTDREEGFPGNVEVVVNFTLNKQNELSIQYTATPDQDTPLALTNHTYFNLSGFRSSIEDHTVMIAAGKKLAMDETGAAPGDMVDLNQQPDDLRSAQKIGEVHQNMKDGFEHYYIFDKDNFDLESVARFACEESGRGLEVLTSEPGMLFYTGKYTSDSLARENGQQFGKYRGFCCETHRYPNGPNMDHAPGAITKAGEVFRSTTVFRFQW